MKSVGQLKIVQGDITKFKGDAIVNAANTSLMGGGGVDGAIHRAAGPQLYDACRPFHGCPTGEARITPGFKLPVRFIIHTPGPIWRGGDHREDQLLKNSYQNSLLLAAQHQCKTIAFPSISTGVFAFPLQRAASIAVNTITDFLKHHESVNEVTMVCFDQKTLQAYQEAQRALD